MRLAASVEQDNDGVWTAVASGNLAAVGSGTTKDEALGDLRRSLSVLILYLKAQGEEVPESTVEVMCLDVP